VCLFPSLPRALVELQKLQHVVKGVVHMNLDESRHEHFSSP
jgi:hypothetical protein